MKRIASVILSLLALSTVPTGCARTYPTLMSEDDIVPLSDLKASARALEIRTVRAYAGDLEGEPIRLAVHETRSPGRRKAVVFLHGGMADSASWRFMVGPLGREYDLLAVDLPGCGASDKPDPRKVGEEVYEPGALARRVLYALRDRLARRPEPRDVTLVGHCLGGLVWIRALSDASIRAEFSDVIERVDRMVLFAPVDVAIEKPHAVFLRIANLSDFEVGVGAFLGLLKEESARAMKRAVVDPDGVPREEADRMVEVLYERKTRRAAQAMIRQAIPTRNGLRPDWDRIEEIVEGYARVDVPVLVVWGARDELFPLSMGYKLAAELPRGRLHVIPRSMHNLPWERPEICSSLVRDFIESSQANR